MVSVQRSAFTLEGTAAFEDRSFQRGLDGFALDTEADTEEVDFFLAFKGAVQ